MQGYLGRRPRWNEPALLRPGRHLRGGGAPRRADRYIVGKPAADGISGTRGDAASRDQVLAAVGPLMGNPRGLAGTATVTE